MASELVVNSPVTPMTLIERASAAGASIEQMTQLFELKLRVDADNARQAFNAAMSRFKENPPRITKNVSKKAGSMDLNYASIDHVCDALIPSLAAQGIRHGWSMKQENGQMTVTCTLTHETGYSEGTSMSAPYDVSGGKNAIQAIASAQTYLQRYTLLAATGQAAGGVDDDGNGGGTGQKFLAPEDYGSRRDAILACSKVAEVEKFYESAMKAAEEIEDKESAKGFLAAKRRRLREIREAEESA